MSLQVVGQVVVGVLRIIGIHTIELERTICVLSYEEITSGSSPLTNEPLRCSLRSGSIQQSEIDVRIVIARDGCDVPVRGNGIGCEQRDLCVFTFYIPLHSAARFGSKA